MLEVENTELRARVERATNASVCSKKRYVLKANTYARAERLSVAAGQVELFNEIEATLDITEASA